ncbi:hypothetical protein RvVAR0630_pl05360 (plasmid) [Agrobacterium vitis]|nr:hypothetical protein RvVAR0630_pl05360 [Agrobacterium vitis]
MDTLAPSASTTPTSSPHLPGWALPRGRDTSETDAAFAAGIALKSLDDLIRRPSMAWLLARSARSQIGCRGCQDAWPQ